jgi:hypothetical protein
MSSSRMEGKKRWRSLVLLGGLLLACGIFDLAQGADSGGHALKLTAFAINLGATPDLRRPRQTAQIVDITIDRWSSDAERDELLAALRSKGENGLLAALKENPRVGTIRTPDSIAWDLHFARLHPTADGGQRIFVATDRPISFWEAANLPRSIHYPFTLMEIRLDKNGHGEGKLSIATKIEISQDGKEIELENYATQPVRLQDVHQAR